MLESHQLALTNGTEAGVGGFLHSPSSLQCVCSVRLTAKNAAWLIQDADP